MAGVRYSARYISGLSKEGGCQYVRLLRMYSVLLKKALKQRGRDTRYPHGYVEEKNSRGVGEKVNVALILAGGVGKRMGAGIPKQFIEIKGKPIIVYTLEILESASQIDAIEIICVHGYENFLQEIINRYNINKVRWIIEGCGTFALSVYNGLKNLRNILQPDDLVMIHMSVAPFIGNDIIDDAIQVAEENGNSVSENPCLLCMGSHDNDEYSTKSIVRETITGLNTPQTFLFGEIIYMIALKRKES